MVLPALLGVTDEAMLWLVLFVLCATGMPMGPVALVLVALLALTLLLLGLLLPPPLLLLLLLPAIALLPLTVVGVELALW